MAKKGKLPITGWYYFCLVCLASRDGSMDLTLENKYFLYLQMFLVSRDWECRTWEKSSRFQYNLIKWETHRLRWSLLGVRQPEMFIYSYWEIYFCSQNSERIGWFLETKILLGWRSPQCEDIRFISEISDIFLFFDSFNQVLWCIIWERSFYVCTCSLESF